MKYLITVLLILTSIDIVAQQQYNEDEPTANMAGGIYYQIGPGSNNTLNWQYPYGTKLTVSGSACCRNFELISTAYPHGDLKFRQWDASDSQWTGWRSILMEDENGFVGLGITTPQSIFHIQKGVSGGNPHGYSDLTVEDNENGMISILTPNNKFGYFGFADQDDDYVAGMQYNHSSDKLTFRVNNHNSDVVIDSNGNVGIGTNSPDTKLTVKGNIHAEEVKIDLSVPGPDYVFTKDYDLLSIEEVKQHIADKGHLPNIPSAIEMEANGVELGVMNMKLLEKIEELTLYTIAQEEKLNELDTLKEQNKTLQKELRDQKIKLAKLEEKLNLLLKD
ncbi:tail fiber protein [Aquimarina brevivitae]|uniref:Cell wall anchor protein n=1 Tax=Aquimarina brevivitae TaxID=323412 RepID=A0A4Q7NTN2_9FLAO|nr:tail fiber protein [Aquimarina brevivitae]RZS90543.1 hypothetical protein EV197_3337 [Aquimarina brevivitae]